MPNLLNVDLRMSEVDGQAVLQHLWDTPQVRRISVLVISGLLGSPPGRPQLAQRELRCPQGFGKWDDPGESLEGPSTP